MTQFHVTDEGKVLPCRATIKPCIYSSRADERHFENIEDAKSKSTEMLSKAYSPFGSVKKVRRNKTKPYDNLNIDISDISLAINRTPRVKPLPSGIAYEDFERVLEQIAGETDWYYEKV